MVTGSVDLAKKRDPAGRGRTVRVSSPLERLAVRDEALSTDRAPRRYVSMDVALDAETRCTVLFVDDEPLVLAGLRDSLRKYPFSILTAKGGAEGLTLLAANPVDVVVSDERMPSMTGAEFLAIVRQRYPRTLRIVLTGQASLDAAIRAINEGEVYRFLTKPCGAAELAVAIQQGLQLRASAQEDARCVGRTRAQDRILRDLEQSHPGISEVKRDVHGAIELEDSPDVDELMRQIDGETP